MEGPDKSTGLNSLSDAFDAAVAQKKAEEAAAPGVAASAQETQEKQKENELFKYFLDAFSVQVNDAKDKNTFIESLEAAHTTLFEDTPDSSAAAKANKFIEWINDELNTLSDQVQKGKSKDEIDDDIARIVDNIESYSPGAGAVYGAALKKFAFAAMPSVLNVSAPEGPSAPVNPEAGSEPAKQENAPKPEPTPTTASVEAEQNREYIEGEKTKLANLEKGLLYNLAQINLGSADESVEATNERFLKSIKINLEAQKEVYKRLNGTGAVSAQDIQNVDAALGMLGKSFTQKDLETIVLGSFVAKHPDYYAEQKAASQPEQSAGNPAPGPAPKENPKPENAPGAAEKGPTFSDFAGSLMTIFAAAKGKEDLNEAVFKRYDELFGDNKQSEPARKVASFINAYIIDASQICNFAVEHGAKNDIAVSRMIYEAVEKAEKEFPGTAEFYENVLNQFVSEAEHEAMEEAASQADHIPSAPYVPFKFAASPLISNVETERAAREAIANLPDPQARISYILDTYPEFANAWNKDADRAAKLESEKVSDEDAMEFVAAFEAYAVMPRVVEEYQKLAKEKLKSPLFEGVDIRGDITASLEEKITDNPLEIVRLAQQLEARKDLEQGIPALEARLRDLGGLEAAEGRARKIEEELEKYEAAEQAGFFTPVMAHTKAVAYGIRDMWNKAWGNTGHEKKAAVFGDIEKLLKDKVQEYNSLMVTAMDAARLTEEAQRLQGVVDAAELSGDASLQFTAQMQYNEYIHLQNRLEALRIFNEGVDTHNEMVDKEVAERRKVEQQDMVRTKARDEVIAKEKYDEKVEVNLLDPRQVFGIFGKERRTMGNPYRPEFRKQIELLKEKLAAARAMTTTIETNQSLKKNAERIVTQLQTNAFETLGVEQVLRKRAIAALDNVMSGDYGSNLETFAQVGALVTGDIQAGGKELANAAEKKLASFAETQGNFAKSIRTAIERALVTAAPGKGPISKLRSALVDPLKKNPEPKAVQAVTKIVGTILTEMRTKKAAEKDLTKQAEYSNKIIHLGQIQVELAKLVKN